jgi:hypothetical protein
MEVEHGNARPGRNGAAIRRDRLDGDRPDGLVEWRGARLQALMPTKQPVELGAPRDEQARANAQAPHVTGGIEAKAQEPLVVLHSGTLSDISTESDGDGDAALDVISPARCAASAAQSVVSPA